MKTLNDNLSIFQSTTEGFSMAERMQQAVKQELSGETAKSYVAQITRFHRIQASTMFHDAAEYVKATLRRFGLKDANIEQYPSDGEVKYWTYVSPVGWEAKSAELHLVKPEAKLLVRYKDVPTSLHTYSKATPPEGVTAQLIDVGEGIKSQDYEGQDVKGKFVLATGRARKVHELAVYKYGAAGVLTDTVMEMKNVREAVDVPDAHAYQAIWPTKQDLERVTFGFSLSRRQGNYLRGLLKGGKPVVLKGKVAAKLFAGHMDVVTATIRGRARPNEEVFLVAHLCHPQPSANDNASGSGLLLEVARTITTLIDARRIPRPRRTIRFLWVPETLGTTAYLYHHEKQAEKLIAGVNLDMVGENQELCRSTLNLDRTPDSNPSYLNDFVWNLIERSVELFDPSTPFGSASTFRFRSSTFSGGSDHVEFNESTFSVPCVMLLQWPDLYYHSSLDTIDKVSEDSLRRVGWVTTVAALALADATAKDAVLLANLAKLGGTARIDEVSKAALTALFTKKRLSPKELAKILFTFRNRMDHAVWRETHVVQSVKRLGTSREVDRVIRAYVDDLKQHGQLAVQRFEETLGNKVGKAGLAKARQVKETAAAKEARRLTPKRLFKGALSDDALKQALGEKEYEWYDEVRKKDGDFGKKLYEMLNFMDGKRTVYDVALAVSAEYSEIRLEDALKVIRDLAKTQFISFQ
jgi:aminopeptidase-like protein